MATTEQIALDYFNKGVSYIHSNNVQGAVDNLKMAKVFFEELGNDEYCVRTMHALAIGYGMLGYNTRFIQTLLEGINYCDTHDVKGAKHLFYSDITNRYIMLKDYDNALNYGLIAIQDLEDFGENFPNYAFSKLVAYLNICYAYICIRKYEKAQEYFDKAKKIMDENDIYQHEGTFKILHAALEYGLGNRQYIYDNMDDLVNIIKNTDVTVEDFLLNIMIIVKVFNSMELYDQSLQIIKSLEVTTARDLSSPLHLELIRLKMDFYKMRGDMENYRETCVRYAEDAIARKEAATAQQLLDMDTAIALNLAGVPIDLESKDYDYK